MKIHFWGTRGSLPFSLTEKFIRKKIFKVIKKSQDFNLDSDERIENFINDNLPFSTYGSYGCNTSCVEIRGAEEHIICDAGSGLRDFGNFIMALEENQKKKLSKIFHIFISHLHWDHIQGFPFFKPAFISDNTINIYGFHNELKQAFINQQNPPYFPLPLKAMQGNINFIPIEVDKEYEIANFIVKGIKQNHPGDSYGYSFIKNNKKVIYSTDAEHKKDVEEEDYPFIDFFRNADLLIFDAQYNLRHAIDTNESWGHSSNLIGVELSVKARVKHLCLFHNEHTFDDEMLEKFLNDTRKYLKLNYEFYPLKIDLAYDGLEIEI